MAMMTKAGVPTTLMPAELLSSELVSEEERLQRLADSYNSQEGSMSGFDCRICKNKGQKFIVANGELISRLCECRKIRETMRNIEQSGLADVIDRYTFEAYTIAEWWQKDIKSKAIDYTQDNGKKWFFIGGQSGCGKTHICTAIANHFLQNKILVKYMLWRDESVRILANATDDRERRELVEPLKRIPVLYIDDFLKHRRGVLPSPAETNLAYEIINYRSINSTLKTIISSELTVNDIVEIDEAMGGRIRDMTAPSYMLSIKVDRKKNYRLRELKV